MWMDGKFSPFKQNSLKKPLEKWGKWIHQTALLDLEAKEISSSEAHTLVKSSPYFNGRKQRAKKRLKALTEAFKQGDWNRLCHICKEEFLDLHSLFETARPPFSYRNKSSKQVLSLIDNFWKKQGDGPLITMDAGANIHLFYRQDQKDLKKALDSLLTDFPLLNSLE